MSPESLRLLHLIGEAGALTGAADELGLSTPAVSQQLARLEDDLDLSLVDRGPRGARLTPAGRVLAAHGRLIDEETHRAADSLAGLRGQHLERLRIGAIHAAALHLLPQALTALHHRYPGAEVSVADLLSVDAIDAVVDDRLDVALMAVVDDPPTWPQGIVGHDVLRDPLIVVLPDDHPLVLARPEARTLSLSRLRDEPWVVISSGMAARAQFDRAAAAAGFVPAVRSQTESYDIAQALVGTGYGVAMISRLAHTAVEGTAVRAVRPALSRRLVAVTRADHSLTPLVQVVLGLLADVSEDLTAAWAAADG